MTAASGPIDVVVERFPIAGAFTISRGSKTEAVVVVARVARDGLSGSGECVPYARYGETVEGAVAALRQQADFIRDGADRRAIQRAMAPGAARNALDCALWCVEARRAREPVWRLAGLPPPRPVVTAYTLSLSDPSSMHEAAVRAAGRPLLKIKLGGDGDDERIRAVRRGAPDSELIVDANEAWNGSNFGANLRACVDAGVSLIEQPLPAGADGILEDFDSPIPLCADESFHGASELDAVARRYRMINLKLDKTGGLTEAIAVAEAARARGLGIMVGCMLGTSLGMAPAFLLAPWARYVDLDGPLLLARDREPGFRFDGSTMLADYALDWN
ncbi:MAG TPA: N-acetyl-D-Glu racemase DgcA [Burkholderiaceae bacterium]|nr:N-acetyl-D-Glu racemase DgcA [Burkholderiaceae bacterium]